MKYIIGIDPGEKGAICALDSDGKIVDYEPFIKNGEEPDWDYNQNILISFLEMGEGNNEIWTEDLHALGLVKASTNFKLGRFLGWVHGVCSVFGPVNFVKPKTWQKKIWEISEYEWKNPGEKDTKAISLKAATRIFPDDKFIPKDCNRCSVANDGIVDSCLIAYYGYLKQNNG